MRRVRTAGLLLMHLYRLWRGGQLRFRLETYGVYYPSLPYAAPWWRVSLRSVALLIRQLPSYAAWIEEMETLRTKGPTAWWERQ
jgi:hypothetical protein